MSSEFTQTTLNEANQPSSPSNALRTARERLNLSAADIANQLNLTVNIVEKIETNQFADIAPIFVRGYIRSYAKTVKLSDEDTQKILACVIEKEFTPTSSSRVQTTRFIREKKRWPNVLFYIIIIAILVAAARYWNKNHQPKAEVLVEAIETMPATASETTQANNTVEQVEVIAIPDESPVIAVTEAAPEAQQPEQPAVQPTQENVSTSE